MKNLLASAAFAVFLCLAAWAIDAQDKKAPVTNSAAHARTLPIPTYSVGFSSALFAGEPQDSPAQETYRGVVIPSVRSSGYWHTSDAPKTAENDRPLRILLGEDVTFDAKEIIAGKPQDQPAPKSASPVATPPQAKPAQPQGRIVTQPLTELRRHPRPNPTPGPVPHLPPRPGHGWHYHGHYQRWFLLPVAVAPRTVLIPDSYALPPQVAVYSDVAAIADHVFTCPHCSQIIQVSK